MRREYSAGGAVYRQINGGRKWLIIKPKDKDRWQLPKGLIDQDESSAETALREVREEAGVEADLIDKVETIRIFFRWPPKDQLQAGEIQEQVSKSITFFLMEAVSETESGPDSEEIDRVQWLPFEKAVDGLTYKNEKEVLRKAKEMVELTQRLF